MMKIPVVSIKSIITLALISIVSLQTLWLYNMYVAYRKSIQYQVSVYLNLAIEEDLINRNKQLGGPITFTTSSLKEDTTIMRNFIIVSKDTTIIISYRSADFYNYAKSRQSAFKYFMPLDIYDLDSIFNDLLAKANIPVKQTLIELYDRDKNNTIRTGQLASLLSGQVYETEMIYVDLTDSIGIKAYVQTPYATIFRNILFQLVLSAILIFAVAVCLFRLSQTIFRQRKEELVKRNFVDVMTHELKRPIASVMTALDFIQENKPANADELLSDSIFALKKLNLYVEKIQEISRGENENVKLIKEMIPLQPFFAQLKEKYESFDEKVIFIDCQVEPDLNFTGDKIHFSNIMENLTENSIKYSGDSITVTIRVFRQDGQLHIIHRDNGWGIPNSEIHRIFDRFYRGKSAEKRRKKGFGLGLSYVKLMIEKMDGTISVSSKEKEFTEFKIIIPL